MITRDFKLTLKGLDEQSGSFTGYAATYGNVDLAMDVIEPGAFRQAIAQQGKGYPLLWAHRSDEPLGLGRVEDARDGLLVHGQLLMSDPAAVRAHEHLKAGTVRGLSIGFTVPSGTGKALYRDDGVRVLKEIRLHEISLTAIPCNPQATITAVKSLGDVRHILSSLRDSDVNGDVLGDLREIDRELKRLLVHDPHEQTAAALRELRTFAAELKRIAV